MIDESYYWKQPLLVAATWMRRLSLTEHSSPRTFVRLEREVFVGFYAIRKLFDTRKVTDSVRKMQFDLQTFPCIKKVDYLNCYRIDELYDLSSASAETRDLIFICNLFVHSYVFLPVVDQNFLAGFYVSSDKARQNKVFLVTISQVLKAFRAVGHDDPRHISMVRDPITGQFEGTIE